MTTKKRREPYKPFKGGEVFRKIASRTAHGVGHPVSFIAAAFVVLLWAFSGHFFRYSDTWQLVINTGTTIVTFLMVFLIQNTQNRDSHEIHIKLDELIRVNQNARDHLMALEELSEQELDELQLEFGRLAREKIAARDARISSIPPSDPRPQAPRSSRTSSSRTGARSSRTTSRSASDP